ncbi:MAG: hypothetical protein PHF84_01560 [bacterium]|nr:hypothetical protein [bacterium]
MGLFSKKKDKKEEGANENISLWRVDKGGTWGRLNMDASDTMLDTFVKKLELMNFGDVVSFFCVKPSEDEVQEFEQRNSVKMQWFRILKIEFSANTPDDQTYTVQNDIVILSINDGLRQEIIEKARWYIASVQQYKYYHEIGTRPGLWFAKEWINRE